MKKIELVVVLLFGLLIGGGVVYYYGNKTKISIKSSQESISFSGNTDIKDRLNELENQFKEIVKGKTYVQLIKDPSYQSWVKEINNIIERQKRNNNKAIVNYIYYNYISELVLKYLPSYSNLEKDLVIQSVRRIDFNTLTDKNYYTQLMKDYVDNVYYKPILKELSNVDTKKLDTDKDYFYKVMLDPQNGIFYKIFKNRYDWNKTGIGFKPEFLENQFVDFLSQRFEQILTKLGYDKKWFKKKVFDYYGVKNLEGFAKLVKKDYEYIKNKYDIEKLGIPTDRFFRMDERRDLFKNDGLHNRLYKDLGSNLEEFKKDIKQYRLKMYLLSYLGKDINLFNDKVRAKFVFPEEGGGIQNLFRVSRYVDEVMKLELKPEVR